MKHFIHALALSASLLSAPALAEDYFIRIPTGAAVTTSPESLAMTLVAGPALPQAVVGVPYSVDLRDRVTITGETQPDYTAVSWALLTPAPAGLALSANGVLSGTPLDEGVRTFEVAVTYKSAQDAEPFVIEVALEVDVSLAAGTPPTGVVGQAYPGFDARALLTVSGDPSFNMDAVVWTVKQDSALPGGLSLDADTGVITGMPTAAFSGPVTLVATYKGEQGEQVYDFVIELNIVVSLSETTLPNGVVGQVYPGFDFKTVASVTGDPDYTSNQLEWSVKEGSSLPAGLSIDPATGMLSGTPETKTEGTGQSFTLLGAYKNKEGEQVYTLIVNGNVLEVKQIAAGDHHACAVTVSGGAVCWGYNINGQLGDGTKTDRSVPTAVAGLGSGVAKVAASLETSCAVMTSGVAMCWGKNTDGQLGNGGVTNSTVPVSVSGLSDVADIAPGRTFTCARTNAGGVKCWGKNTWGYLGNGTQLASSAPVNVTGLTSGVISLSSSHSHSCAVKSNGEAVCWGWNDYGQLGDNSVESRFSPVVVSGLTSGVKAISAGINHSCAVMISGAVKCWGLNTYGNLGDAATQGSSVPVKVPVTVSGLSGVDRMDAGGYHNCAVTTTGGAKCWGYNNRGQLGNNSATDSATPVNVEGLSSGVASITGGGTFTCASMTNGEAKCWGFNSFGRLGDGTLTTRHVPGDVLPQAE